MAIAKLTISFSQQNYGWTENYFRDNASANLQVEMAQLKAVAAKRILLSGAQTVINYLKVSNESVDRDVYLEPLLSTSGGPYTGTGSEISDAPDTALLIRRFNLARDANAPMFLRGVWDRLVTNGGVFNYLDPLWQSAWNSYGAQLLASQIGFLSKDDASSFSKIPIATVTQAISGQIHFTTTAPLFLIGQVGEKVKVFISGVQGARTLNGAQVVIPSGVQTADTVKRLPMFPYISGGIATNSELVFKLIANQNMIRVVERRPGRPLYLSRGRSKGRVLA